MEPNPEGEALLWGEGTAGNEMQIVGVVGGGVCVGVWVCGGGCS